MHDDTVSNSTLLSARLQELYPEPGRKPLEGLYLCNDLTLWRGFLIAGNDWKRPGPVIHPDCSIIFPGMSGNRPQPAVLSVPGYFRNAAEQGVQTLHAVLPDSEAYRCMPALVRTLSSVHVRLVSQYKAGTFSELAWGGR